ncbi:hypothetical protein [Actinomadura meridiana]|uniref:hypothetical protein n=1 Tax=Actinomadura meridiana TaxID=559626 RepID=UPI0031E7EBE9
MFDRDVPNIGESVTLVHGTTPGLWWYRSSTGEDLAPHTQPVQAAKRVTRILIPYVTAVRAARSHQTQATGERCSPPPARPDPSHAPTIAELQRRFAGVVCWWGAYTYEWWAIVPGGTQWKIVNAEDPDTLIQRVLNTRKRR